jgi:hypothetical protein
VLFCREVAGEIKVQRFKNYKYATRMYFYSAKIVQHLKVSSFLDIILLFADERCIVDGQRAKMYPPRIREPMSSSSVRIGGASSSGNTNIFHQNQPRSQLQGPMLTGKERLDARNKNMDVPTPAKVCLVLFILYLF